MTLDDCCLWLQFWGSELGNHLPTDVSNLLQFRKMRTHIWSLKQTSLSPAFHLPKATTQQPVTFIKGTGQGDILIKWWGLENATPPGTGTGGHAEAGLNLVSDSWTEQHLLILNCRQNWIPHEFRNSSFKLLEISLVK